MSESEKQTPGQPLIQVSNAQLQALLHFSLAINQPLEVEQILVQVVEHARQLTGCENAGVVLVDVQRNQFERDYSTGQAPLDRRMRRPGGATRWILDTGEPVVVPNTRQDRFGASPMSPENGIYAYAGVPIRHAEGLVGVLYALSRRAKQFSPAEMEVMRALANMMALALHNARVVKTLREVNDYMNAMLQVAAHDLRNPLGSASGALKLLNEELLQSQSYEQRRFLGIIRSSLTRMEDLVEGILNYQRWSGEGELDWQPHDLNAIARKVVGDFEPLTSQKSQQFTFEPTDGPLVVVADELLLREGIGNLVSNASKYAPRDGRVTLRTENDGAEFVVVVEDNGPGIAPEDQKKLFQPFVRLEATAGERGTGLGLSIVKKIVERHGGRVALESTLGEGAKFYIFLPEYTL